MFCWVTAWHPQPGHRFPVGADKKAVALFTQQVGFPGFSPDVLLDDLDFMFPDFRNDRDMAKGSIIKDEQVVGLRRHRTSVFELPHTTLLVDGSR